MKIRIPVPILALALLALMILVGLVVVACDPLQENPAKARPTKPQRVTYSFVCWLPNGKVILEERVIKIDWRSAASNILFYTDLKGEEYGLSGDTICKWSD